MINETETINQLIQKLIELGYSESDLQANASTNYDRGIDLVAYESSKPKIVFEVKISENITSLLGSLSEEQIRFNSMIRQVQSLAKDIGAPYFAIYDGNKIYWFGIDESGRPKRLPNPVLAQSVGETKDAGLRFAHALYRLNDIGLAKFPFMLEDLLVHVGVSVLAWVLSKKGEPALKNQLLSSQPNLNLTDDYLYEADIFRHSFSKDFYSTALPILDQVSLPEGRGREIIRVLDEYLEFTFGNKRTELIRLPIWISEFLANLGVLTDSDIVLDLYSTFDDVVIASYDIAHKATLYSITTSTLTYVWAQTKRSLLGIGKARRASPSFREEYFYNLNFREPSVVFVTPPFGMRISSGNYEKQKRSEEIFLEAAVEIVKRNGKVIAIMPDGFLLSKSQQWTREKIMDIASLKAVFSLDQFMPGTSIKASVLVLEKRRSEPEDKILFARIQQSDIEAAEGRTKSIQKGSRLQKILDFYKRYKSDNSITTRLKDVFQIPASEVTPATWALTSYVVQRTMYSSTEYPLVRLDNIAKFSKGSPLKLSKSSGNIPVIGPGAVRAFSIDQSNFDFTEQELLTSSPVISQKGNILVNAVGPYRGHSALVEQESDGINISRNIVVIKPSLNEVLPEYLTLVLNSEAVQQQLRELSTGSVIPQLTTGKLKDLLIPVPPIEVQETIIEKVQTIRKEIASSEKKIQEIQLDISKLTKQLQSMVDGFESSGDRNG